ncbi:MAG: hypothetical protein GY906_04865 [bacterium]|nr:hypothetical protein [bacterium]
MGKPIEEMQRICLTMNEEQLEVVSEYGRLLSETKDAAVKLAEMCDTYHLLVSSLRFEISCLKSEMEQ